jgi:hypothetical protein
MIVSFAGAFREHNGDFSPSNAVFSEGKQLVSWKGWTHDRVRRPKRSVVVEREMLHPPEKVWRSLTRAR